VVESEEVVGVVATLERLEPVVLLGPVGLADPLLTLLQAHGRTAFGKLMAVANQDKRAVVLIAQDVDQVASTDES
jgi:hypothetical protein